MINIATQIRQNLLSIISLVVAISALIYNTYRNELTEINRNKRHTGFELLKELNQLQLLIDYAHYDKNTEQGNPIMGWWHVMYVKDMSHLISDTVVEYANQLAKIWAANWATVYDNRTSNQLITEGVDTLRNRVRYKIKMLE